jgi:hypothetical protein
MLLGPLNLITAIAPPPEVAGAQIVFTVLIISKTEFCSKFRKLWRLLKLYINHPDSYCHPSPTKVEAGNFERWFLHTPYFWII